MENYNGLVRQYFPKGYDFTTITQERLWEEINNRLRKVHAYMSPIDFFGHLRAN